MNRTDLVKTLLDLRACEPARDWVSKQPKTLTPAKLWARCPDPRWMLWLAGRAGIDRKALALCACDCAEYAVERHVPKKEKRPAEAIRITRLWCEGKATLEEVHTARSAALEYRYAAVAYAAADAAADAAAYAAAAAVDVVAAAYAAAAAVDVVAAADAAADADAALKHLAKLVRARISARDIEKALAA